jgi:hypothetical protein
VVPNRIKLGQELVIIGDATHLAGRIAVFLEDLVGRGGQDEM